jgi:hypothetical protein
MKRIIFFLGLLSLLLPKVAYSKIGVGIGTGKIVVENKLKAGMIYELPPITILNTGDTPATYGVSITFHQNQPQFIPPQEWFSFSPAEFRLEPGKVQIVKVTLKLPLKINPGEYFAYVEGHPIIKSETGQTSVGVAAAAKLYFTVAPANLVLGIYYRGLSFWKIYHRWLTIIAVILVIAAAVIFFRRFFHIQINLRKNGEGTNG